MQLERADLVSNSDQAPSTDSSPREQKRFRVLVVDDHPVTRQGLVALLNQQPNMEVCGQAQTSEEAIAAVETLQPDLMTLDLILGEDNGIDIINRLRAAAPELAVLVVSLHDETYYAEHALRAGAMGYVMKQEASEQVVLAMQHLLRGEIFLSARTKQRLFTRFVHSGGENPVFAIDALSDREKEVFTLLGDGFSTRQIAEQLGLSSKTIDSHRENLKLKLSLRSAEELVRHAILSGNSTSRGRGETPRFRRPPSSRSTAV